MDLNVVYQCKRDKGGCGHVFSLGDQRVMLAYLNGDLIPRVSLDRADRRIAELEGELAEVKAARHYAEEVSEVKDP